MNRSNKNKSGARRRRNRGFPGLRQALRELDIPTEALASSNPQLRRMARTHAVTALAQSYPESNFDWGSLIDGFLDAGSAFGDLILPGIGTASKAAKMVYKAVKPKEKAAVVRAVQKEEKKVERTAEKESVKTQGLFTGTRSSSNMVRRARIRPGSRDTVLIDGCDVISNLTSGSGGLSAGQVVTSIRLNPLAAGAMQLKTACAKYEQYVIRRLSLHCPGGAGTTVSGTMITLFDYDPDDLELTGAGEENVRVALTHAGAQTHTLWQGFSHHYKREDTATNRLFVSDSQTERRLTDAGRFYIVAGQPVAPNVSIGPLYMEWELELHVRSDDNSGPTGDAFYFAQATNCSSAAKLGSASSASMTSMGLSALSIDYALGTMVFPAGSYLVSQCVSENMTFSFSGSSFPITNESPSVTDPAKNFWVGSGTDGRLMATMWVSSTSQFTLRFNVTAVGLWATRIYVSAMAKSPYGLNLRDLRRVLAMASSATSDAQLVEKIKSDNTAPTSDDDKDTRVMAVTSMSSSLGGSQSAKSLSSRRA